MDQQNWTDLDSRFQELSEYNQDLQRFEPKTYEELHEIKPQTISTTTYTKDAFSLDMLRDTINGIFVKDPERILKIYTHEGGFRMFQEAMEKEFQNKFG